MTHDDYHLKIREQTILAMEAGVTVQQVIGTLESMKLIAFYSTVSTAHPLRGDGATTRPEEQKVSG